MQVVKHAHEGNHPGFETQYRCHQESGRPQQLITLRMYLKPYQMYRSTVFVKGFSYEMTETRVYSWDNCFELPN